ncbi:ATP5A1 isoform 7, partial [Pongo abelii]
MVILWRKKKSPSGSPEMLWVHLSLLQGTSMPLTLIFRRL